VTYFSSLLVLFVIQSILVLGLNFGYGTSGLLNFTYITFVAIGAYIGTIFSIGPPSANPEFQYVYLGTVPWPVYALLGGVAAAIGGAILSAGILRGLRSDYLAIVTVAAGTIFYTIVGDTPGLFNGFQGFFNIPNPAQSILNPVGEQLAFAGLCAIFLVVILAALILIHRSPLGRALRAVRDDGALLEALGRNVFIYRFWALVVSCFIAGLGGSLLASYATAFNPDAYLPPETFILFAACILGGRGNNWGALLGAALVPVGISEATRYIPAVISPTFVLELRGALIGVALILVMVWRPGGILLEKPASILRPWFRFRHWEVPAPTMAAPRGEAATTSN
jgi:branched-chain amino acid transport system permease protein